MPYHLALAHQDDGLANSILHCLSAVNFNLFFIPAIGNLSRGRGLFFNEPMLKEKSSFLYCSLKSL
jgi:hypothetical protein